jgi:nucleoside-diphosphate-sugar epimerase
LTKRFASSFFDRELAARLERAENLLLLTCRGLDISCRILRQSIIYGQNVCYSDRNFSRLLLILRRVPLLPFPSGSGISQPIHASQLAAAALRLAR